MLIGAAVVVAGVVAWSDDIRQSSGIPDALVPSSPEIVVEQLPSGYAVAAARDGQQASAARIEALLALASRTGDGRFASRAAAMLDDLPQEEQSSPRILRLRAHSLQHAHRFEEAAQLLDTATTSEPRDSAARLSRAQIRLVLGRVGQAMDDCRAMALGVDVVRGVVCAAAVELRLGRYTQAAQLLDSVITETDRAPEVMAFAGLMRAEVASRAGEPKVADRWFARSLKQSPDDVRVTIAAARHFRRTDRPTEALALLDLANDSDGIRVQQALAALEAGHFGADRRARQLLKEFARAREQGAVPEARDEAELLLATDGDAMIALELARGNFRTQRDYEDVAILQQAARRANRPDALVELRGWAARERVPIDGTTE